MNKFSKRVVVICIKSMRNKWLFRCHFFACFLIFTAFRQRKIYAHVAAKIPSVLRLQWKTNDQTVSLIMRFCLGTRVPKATTIVLNIPPQDRKCVITQFWRNDTDILSTSPRVAFINSRCQLKAKFLNLRFRVTRKFFFPHRSPVTYEICIA